MESLNTVRRSERSIKVKRSFSPEPVCKAKRSDFKSVPNRNKLSLGSSLFLNNTTFRKSIACDQCKSPFYLLPVRKGKNVHKQVTKRYMDAKTNQILTLCTTCSLSFNCRRKSRQKKQPPTLADKEKYLEEAKTFAQSLVEVLQDPEAERLYCPEFKNQPCACLQKYVLSDVNESQQRAVVLLRLLKEAKTLSQKKSYSHVEAVTIGPNNKKTKSLPIGLGNGQKRSKDFEDFVIQKRSYLRDELHLCERATQKVLVYSNNFLHKRLKTEPERERRVERKKGKSVLGLLKPMGELSEETCCSDYCTSMAQTHEALLQQWRERAASSQAEAWRVLGEMLTPCGGGRTNCFKFIAMVTGCSHGTICKVKKQMNLTGGEREPPEHGLKRWWQDQAKQGQEDVTDGLSNQRIPVNEFGTATSSSTQEAFNSLFDKMQTTLTVSEDNILGIEDSNLPLVIESLTENPLLEIGPRQSEQLAELQRDVIDWQADLADSNIQINELVLTQNNLNLITGSTDNQSVQTVHHLILDESNFETQYLTDGLGNIVILQSEVAPDPLSS